MGRIAVIVTFFGLLAQSPTTYDLSADFSLQHNPNKVWQYGYSATHSLAPDQFRVDKHADTTGPVGFWHPDANDGLGPGYYPYIAITPRSSRRLGLHRMAGSCAAARSPWKRVIAANTVWFASWRPSLVATRYALNSQAPMYGLRRMCTCCTMARPSLTPTSMAMEETRRSARCRGEPYGG